MPQIKSIDRAALRLLRDEMDQALEVVANKYGVEISTGNASFTNTSGTFKVSVNTKGENGEVKSKESEAFKRQATYYGLEASDLGRSFIVNGDTYKISGLSPRSRKYPILAERLDGKGFKFGADTVKRCLV